MCGALRHAALLLQAVPAQRLVPISRSTCPGSTREWEKKVCITSEARMPTFLLDEVLAQDILEIP